MLRCVFYSQRSVLNYDELVGGQDFNLFYDYVFDGSIGKTFKYLVFGFDFIHSVQHRFSISYPPKHGITPLAAGV